MRAKRSGCGGVAGVGGGRRGGDRGTSGRRRRELKGWKMGIGLGLELGIGMDEVSNGTGHGGGILGDTVRLS